MQRNFVDLGIPSGSSGMKFPKVQKVYPDVRTFVAVNY